MGELIEGWTDPENLGVFTPNCPKCLVPLEVTDSGWRCPECGTVHTA